MELIKPQKGTNYNIEHDIQNLTTIEQGFEQIDNKITNDITSSIDELKDKVDNDITTAITELDNKVDTEIVTAIDNLETKVNTEISESITALDNKVTTSLQEQAESLKKEISDQIAKVIANSPEDFDTLKEISDWINGHSSDATSMNSAISGNTSAINQEILDRQAADTALQTNINKKANTSSVFIKTVLSPTWGNSAYIYYKFESPNSPILAMNESSPNTIGFLMPNDPYFICLYSRYIENSSWTLTGIYYKGGYYYLRLSGYQALLLLSNTSISYESSTETDFLKTDLGDSVSYMVPKLMTKILSDELFNDKVDKVAGKGLSTNDYTTTEKNKLAGIANGANKTIVDSSLSNTSTNPVQNKVVNAALGNKVDKNSRITITNTTDLTLSSFGSEALSIGTSTGQNLGFDVNEIQSRSNGAASQLYINSEGGTTFVGKQNDSNSGLTVYGRLTIPTSAPSSPQAGDIWIG
jgi:hypothetical protein